MRSVEDLDREQMVLADQGVSYVGFRLRYVLTRRAAAPENEDYTASYARRSRDFLNNLMNRGDERFTYDLRLISQPDSELYTRGTASVALLCRGQGVGREQMRRQQGELLRLLQATFDEHEFEPLGAAEIRRALRPFDLNHLAAICRRSGPERLDTLDGDEREAGSIGFRPRGEAADSQKKDAASVLHIAPFRPTYASYGALFELLLRQPAPVAVSVRLRPTSLRREEARFLEEQITACERAAQMSLGPSRNGGSGLRPTLRRQARAYQNYQSRLLGGLRDQAGVMTVELASPNPLPATVVDTLGTLITRPSGSGSGEQGHLAGGYDMLDRSGDDEAREAFARGELDPASPNGPPDEVSRLLHLFDCVEATAAFCFPPAPAEETPGLPCRRARRRPPPGELPEEGTLLGVSQAGDTEHPVRIAPEDRMHHVYVVGKTGTGKTTLLKTMAVSDMRRGEGLCVVDPHGDLFRDLRDRVPEERADDVVIIDPTDPDRPFALNLLEYENADQRHFVVQEFVAIMRRLLEDEFQGSLGEFAGPVFFQHVRKNLLLVTSDPEEPGTLLDFYRIFQEPGYWERWTPLQTDDPMLERWVEEVLPETEYMQRGRDGLSLGEYVASKFEPFLFDPTLRRIFAQKRSTVDLRAAMDEGKIVLVNLAKGRLTESNARFFGMLLMAKLMAEATRRVEVPEADRRPFHLYVDEFQSLATQSFTTLLSEARKFGLSLTLANQFLHQIENPRIVRGILGNVGTTVCFRIGQEDADLLAGRFKPSFSPQDLRSRSNWEACVSGLVNGKQVRSFSLRTVRYPWNCTYFS